MTLTKGIITSTLYRAIQHSVPSNNTFIIGNVKCLFCFCVGHSVPSCGACFYRDVLFSVWVKWWNRHIVSIPESLDCEKGDDKKAICSAGKGRLKNEWVGFYAALYKIWFRSRHVSLMIYWKALNNILLLLSLLWQLFWLHHGVSVWCGSKVRSDAGLRILLLLVKRLWCWQTMKQNQGEDGLEPTTIGFLHTYRKKLCTKTCSS